MAKPLILVVDDDPDIRTLVQRHLIGAGYDVATAEDADSARDCVAERTPDLVIADINLPEVSGIEFVATLREYSAPRMIPVIYLTALEQTSELAARTAGYPLLGKPVDPKELIALVAREVRSAPPSR